jgi:import inner membrane translocase subunit TIM44
MHCQVAFYAHQPTPRPPGFFGKLFENIKEEYNKSKEMKESLKKFREDAEKLEQSDALKQARYFFFNGGSMSL